MIEKRAGLVLATALLFIISLCRLTKAFPLPRQLHCNAEVYFKNPTSKEFDWYQVDEYVDFDRTRSSLQLINMDNDQTKVFYNSRSKADGASRRKFLVYDQSNNECKKTTIYDWPMAGIRKLLVQMLPISLLSVENCDVSLGPIALVPGLAETAAEFRFVRRQFSQVRLVDVDLHERIMDSTSVDQSLIIMVRVLAQSKVIAKMQDVDLTDFFKAAGEDHRKLTDLMSITVCKVQTKALKGRSTSTEEFQCSDKELQLEIDYYILGQWHQGSMAGRSLDKTSYFDFHMNPFLKPIGIGCWDEYDDYDTKRKFSPPTWQFSAEYITSNGSSEMSYVAYDGHQNLIRLDRDGRRSVYDLSRSRSYHADDLDGSALARDLEIAGSSGSSFSSSGPSTSNCVVLDLSDRSLTGSNAMKLLLGFGKSDVTYYLGSKMVDHVAYDVYELQLDFNKLDQNMPIVLQASGYLPEMQLDYKSPGATSYYITIYTLERLTLANDRGRRTTMPVPKYMELWEVGGSARSRRQLINSVQFLQFSWSLEVVPDGDPQMMVGGRRDVDLFFLKPCAMKRASEWQLRFRLSELKSEGQPELSPAQVIGFKQNVPLIRELVAEELAVTLDIPRLSISELDVAFVPIGNKPDLLVDSRLVELPTGLADDSVWGYAGFSDIMTALKSDIISVHGNRHSLESCQLDSLAESRRGASNVLMFCRGLTLCVIFQRQAADGYKNRIDPSGLPDEMARSSNPLTAKCGLSEFKWAPSVGEQLLASRVGGAEIFELINHEFQFEFSYLPAGGNKSQMSPAEVLGPVKYGKFLGRSHYIRVKRLDSLDQSQFSEGAPLVGLRYSTLQEEPGAPNANVELPLTGVKLEQRLRYCQTACQMDEYCQSFSVCLRRKGAGHRPSDCTLSGLRLTGDRIAPLAQSLRQSGDQTSGKPEIRVDGSDQVFRFEREPECNLHPKDMVSAYKVADTLQVRAYPSAGNSSTQTAPKGVANEDDGARKVVSLEDCAGNSYEEALNNHWYSSNFTYCPLDSICSQSSGPLTSLGDAGNGAQVTGTGQTCHYYTRSHRQFYDFDSNARMLVPAQNQTRDWDQSKVATTIGGLSIDDCARDCNLRHSKCLAFDSCRPKADVSFCILYSIRSPLSRINHKSRSGGLLPQEKIFYEDDDPQPPEVVKPKPTLVVDSVCSHYALRRPYFDIRLQQMLSDLHEPQRASSDRTEAEELAEDQRRGADQLVRLRDGGSSAGSQLDPGATSAGIHPLMFIAGLAIGALGLLYSAEISVAAMDLYERRKVQWSSRHQGPRLSQLALANELEHQQQQVVP